MTPEKLSKEDKETYDRLVKYSDFNNLFIFAFSLGKIDILKEQMHDQQKLLDGFSHPKDCELCKTSQ